ncbi:MAG: MFS family permease [Planctomycetota bacterium]
MHRTTVATGGWPRSNHLSSNATPEHETASSNHGLSHARIGALGALTFLLMVPETLPVPVLKGLIVERFQVSASLATLFMVANMIGALIATPLVGLYVDRTGRRRKLCLWALLLDAVLMQSMTHATDYTTFLALRMLEGAMHIGALTLLMSLVADTAKERRGRALGAVGAGLTFGVAAGAAIGGMLGKLQPEMTLHWASYLLAIAFVAAVWLLPRDARSAKEHGYREMLQAVRREPGLRAPLLLAFLDRFTVGFFTAGFPLMLASAHDVDAPTIGKLLGAFLFPFALLSYPCGRLAERWSRMRLVAIGSLIYGLGVALVGIAPVDSLWIIMPICGISSAIMFIPTLLWLLDRTPGIGRSTAIAAFHTAGSLGFLVGPLVCGKLVAMGADSTSSDPSGNGYALAFAVAGGVEILAATLVITMGLRRATR